MLSDINLDEECLMASVDIVGLYHSIPVKKALEIVKKKWRMMKHNKAGRL